MNNGITIGKRIVCGTIKAEFTGFGARIWTIFMHTQMTEIPVDSPQDNLRRGSILLDATVQFSNRREGDQASSERYCKLFYSLIGSADSATTKRIASTLARNKYTPRTIAYYLAMEPVSIAGSFLLITPALWEHDLVALAQKVDVANLSIIARRSDISAQIAKVIVERGDKISCAVLAKNPILKLNSILPNPQVVQASNAAQTKDTKDNAQINTTDDAKALLLEMANRSGKLGRTNTASSSVQTPPASPPVTLFRQMLNHALANDPKQVAREISNLTNISLANVEKIVGHESSTSLALFLKGLEFSRSQGSQLLLAINKRNGRNIAEFTSSMAQFDRFSGSQCRDIMETLGASQIKSVNQNHESGVLEKSVNARRRQIMTTRATPLFGTERKAG